MDTQALRLFVLAADSLNISAAGAKLGMAPSVAGAKLAKLEQSIGADLLHRTTRKVSLSLAGEEFLPFAKEMIAQEDAARAALGQKRSVATGTLRFAAPSTFSQLYIAPLLPEFMTQHPELNLDLRLSDSRYDLIEGSFDLALRSGPLEDVSFKGRKLANDRRILCASPEYLAEHGIPQTPNELHNHDFIAFQKATPKTLISNSGTRTVFEPNCRMVVDDGFSQKLITVAGGGVSVNSLWSVYHELNSGKLVHILPDYELEDASVLWLIYPQANVLSVKVRVFMDFLLENIGRNPIWERAPKQR